MLNLSSNTIPLRKPPPGSAHPEPSGTGRSISAAAAASGVSAKMIRYYESIGLIRQAARSSANYRQYDATAIATLRFIGRARHFGFTMDEVSRLLALWQHPERSSADVKALALAHAADLGRRIAALQEMKTAIEILVAQCQGDDQPACPILDDLAGAQRVPDPPEKRRRHG